LSAGWSGVDFALQRRCASATRSACLMDQLEERHVGTAQTGSRREVLDYGELEPQGEPHSA
jgi:hypothetical protein